MTRFITFCLLVLLVGTGCTKTDSQGALASLSESIVLNIEGAASVISGRCQGPFRLYTTNPNGEPVAMAVNASVIVESNAGALYSDPGCQSEVTSTEIPAGTSEIEIYFRVDTLNALEFNARARVFLPPRTEPVVIAGSYALNSEPRELILSSQSASIASGVCVALEIGAYDGLDELAEVITDYPVELSGASFFQDEQCSEPVEGPVTLEAGQSKKTVYLRHIALEEIEPTAVSASGSVSLSIQVNAGGVQLAGNQNVLSGSCESYQVDLLDGDNNVAPAADAVSVMLSTNGTGAFYSDDACANAANSVEIAEGTTSQVFYHRQNEAGNATISVALGSSNAIAAQLALVIGPSQLAVDAPALVVQGLCNGITISAQDANGTDQPVLADTTVNIASTESTPLYADAACANQLAANQRTITANTSSVQFFIRENPVGDVTYTAMDAAGVLANGQDTVTVLEPGRLEISDGPTFDYGAVSLGAFSDKTFTVTNVGQAPVSNIVGASPFSTITPPFFYVHREPGAQGINPGFPGLGGTCAPGANAAAFTLMPGENCTIVIRFSPVTTNTVNGQISLAYVDSVNVQTTDAFTLRGSGMLSGALDLGFGTNGAALISASSLNAGQVPGQLRSTRASLVQSDGKLVFASYVMPAAVAVQRGAFVQRLNSDGSLDGGFGSLNVGREFLFTNEDAEIQAIQQMADLKLMVGAKDASSNYYLARLNTDGTLDASFGTNGVTTIVGPANGEDMAGLFKQASGRLVIAYRNAALAELVLFGYNSDGSLDANGFGNNGVADFNDSDDNISIHDAVQTSGEVIYLVGSDDDELYIDRLDANGARDNGFNGPRTESFTDLLFQAAEISVSATDSLLITGSATNLQSETNFAAVRIRANGQLVNNFGNDGIVVFDGIVGASEALLKSDDSLFVLANAANSNRISVYSYLSSGLSDANYGQGGVVNVDPGNTAVTNIYYGAVLDSAGSLHLTGTQAADPLLTDGSSVFGYWALKFLP